MTNSFFTVKEPAEAEIIIKKSRFIAAVMPVETAATADQFVKTISKKHQTATHNVFAYVINEQSQRFSDDGEPAGTAGKPVLEVISRKNLTKTAIVVTRYYGGILLGAGGLIRAYSDAAKEGIAKAGIVERILHQKLIITLDYQWLGLVKRELEKANGKKIEINYDRQVNLSVLLPPATAQNITNRLIEATGAQINIEKGELIYF